ncbi:MAG: glycosyltransferase family 1 protein, partial [Candidatus Uhrbacteria bacterium]|nr:glycosyltransferase family 1 protein [Candidatus Uhrbacteria bacterium]
AHVLPKVIPKRTVVTIHDIGFHHFPELYKPIQRWYHEWSTRDILRRASRIITVSEFSKRELVESYNADASKIFVIHLGIDHERYKPLSVERCESVLRAFRLPKPFVLFIGRLEKKKNVATLVKAFHRYKEARGLGDPLQLVLVGQPGVGYEEIEEAIRAGESASAIHLVGYASEEEKVVLLSSATALVHPSWYEGFGFPPLEAMACGCPVICSHAASLPEIVGIENALWFDPADAAALTRQLLHIVNDQSLQEDLRRRGFEWCRRYQWEHTAEKTMDILTSW